MSNSLWSHGLQHSRLPCPLSPRVCSNWCLLSQWCHPIIFSSVVPFSSCPQSFPASGPFPVSQLFMSGGQSLGASVSVLPMNIQDWFSLGLTALISLLSKGLSRVFSNTTVRRHQFFSTQLFFIVQFSHPHMTTGKTMTLAIWIFVGKMRSLLFHTLARFVIAYLSRSKYLLISCLQSQSTVILESRKINSVTSPIFPHLFAMKWWDWMPWLVFWMLSFKPAFSLSSFAFIKRLFCSSSLFA